MTAHFSLLLRLRRASLCLLGALLCCAACALRPPGAQAQPAGLDPGKALTQYLHDVWQIEEGLPQNTVEAILQTSDGYLWLGTEEGLVRFNGYDFTVFDRSNTPAFQESQTVKTLHEDASGTLWIGTRGGGLVRYHDRRFSRYASDVLSGRIVSALAEGADGTLWVGTFESGLFTCRGGTTCVPFARQDRLSSALVRKLLVDEAGALWVGTDRGLDRIRGSTVQRFDPEAGLNGAFIMALAEGRGGALWVSTRAGLNRIRGRRIETFAPEDGWPEEPIWSLREDAAGALWMGLSQSGLLRHHQGAFDAFSPEAGLSHGRVLALHGGREGSFWIGTEGGGLNRLRNATFTTFTTQEGLSGDFVTSVYEDARGAVWIATQGDGLNRLAGGSVQPYTAEDGLASDVVASVYGTADGSLWIGTLGGGLSRLQNGRFTTFGPGDGLPSASVFSLYEDARGTLWLGTDAGLIRYQDGAFTAFTTEDGLPSNFITAIEEDAHRSGLWIGTYDAGLVRLENGRFRQVAAKDDLNSSFVVALYADADGALWIGTYGGGLTRLKGGAATTFTIREGLFDDTVYQILEDDHGRLWMGCNKGIFHVEKRALNAFAEGRAAAVTSVSYDRDDGLESREINGGVQPAGWKGRDGRLWFPTVKGAAVIDPAGLREAAPPPAVVIESATFDGEEAAGGAEQALRPGTERFEFQYAAPTFVAPDEVRYRYRLSGYEAEWSEPTARRVATYTHLDPGAYTFEVMAQGRSGGPWSRAAAGPAFYLQPFFYQHPFFWLVCGLGVMLLGAAAYRVRVRQLRTQQRHLERTVEARTEDLRAAKDHIEAQADELRASLEEKEVLLREIHHRVKNNMQVITSLLNLQAQKVEDRETLTLFNECRDRVASMAMIHERLYQSADLARVDLGAYLRSITAQLFRSYNVRSHQIALDVRVEAGLLGVDQAIPCGLIVNELVSNALKHAFPDGRQGRIGVVFEAEKTQCRLAVRDDGVGLPAGFDVGRSPSLGLKLVQALTKKLRGTLRACEDGGAVFEVCFPAAPGDAAAFSDARPVPSEDTTLT